MTVAKWLTQSPRASGEGCSWNSSPGQLLGSKAFCLAQTVGRDRKRGRSQRALRAGTVHQHLCTVLGFLPLLSGDWEALDIFHKDGETIQVTGSSLYMEIWGFREGPILPQGSSDVSSHPHTTTGCPEVLLLHMWNEVTSLCPSRPTGLQWVTHME